MAVNPMMDGARGPLGAYSAGINGIRAGLNGVADAAQEIAELNVRQPASRTPGTDYLSSATDSLVDLRIYQRQVQASAVVLQSADAMLGYLLDVHA